MALDTTLEGKVIIGHEIIGLPGCDDEPILRLHFDTGTYVDIESAYGGYTGESEGEYPRFIYIDCERALEDKQ